MNSAFKVESCHSNHAGQAHVSMKHTDGSLVSVSNVPFANCVRESLAAEQHEILLQTARVLRQAAAFLDEHARDPGELPTRAVKPGASPQAGEAPNIHGQSLPKT